MAKARSIVEEHYVAEAVDEAVSLYRFAEDVYDAGIWRIARQPKSGVQLKGLSPETWLIYIRPNRLAKSPGMAMRYTYDDDNVYVNWVKFYEYTEEEAAEPQAYIIKKARLSR